VELAATSGRNSIDRTARSEPPFLAPSRYVSFDPPFGGGLIGSSGNDWLSVFRGPIGDSSAHLGLDFGHAAAASVVYDGKILSVILRERVNRVKRTRGMDRRTIEEALAAAGVDLAAVDFVALSTAQRHPFVAADCDFSVTFEGTSAHPAPGKMRERHLSS
jgi:hypothetical protein